jgi:hypothetical protein
MFSRISTGALRLQALVGLPAGAHAPNLRPDALDVSEGDSRASAFDVCE